MQHRKVVTSLSSSRVLPAQSWTLAILLQRLTWYYLRRNYLESAETSRRVKSDWESEQSQDQKIQNRTTALPTTGENTEGPFYHSCENWSSEWTRKHFRRIRLMIWRMISIWRVALSNYCIITQATPIRVDLWEIRSKMHTYSVQILNKCSWRKKIFLDEMEGYCSIWIW